MAVKCENFPHSTCVSGWSPRYCFPFSLCCWSRRRWRSNGDPAYLTADPREWLRLRNLQQRLLSARLADLAQAGAGGDVRGRDDLDAGADVVGAQHLADDRVLDVVGLVDPLELAGIRPATARNPLQVTGPYRWVRHPVYLGWLLALFAAAHMTADRLAFAIISTGYLLVAIPWEEQSLLRAFGEAPDVRSIPFLAGTFEERTWRVQNQAALALNFLAVNVVERGYLLGRSSEVPATATYDLSRLVDPRTLRHWLRWRRRTQATCSRDPSDASRRPRGQRAQGLRGFAPGFPGFCRSPRPCAACQVAPAPIEYPDLAPITQGA